jgi:hypothetical protein
MKVKQENDYLAKNAFGRSEMSLDYKLDDLASNAAEAGLQDVAFQAKHVASQFQSIKIFSSTFVVNGDQSAATSTLSRLSLLENQLKGIASANEKVGPVLNEVNSLLRSHRDAFSKLVENKKTIDDLVIQVSGAAGAIMQGAGAMKADLVADQQRLEGASQAMIGDTERLILMLAVGAILLGATLAFLLGRAISRPMTRCVGRCWTWPPAISTSCCPALDARTSSARWRVPSRSSNGRPSPRLSTMRPRRTGRLARPALRAGPS